MKTAGILGGFGPQTTAKFYEAVFFACQKLNPTTKPHILISSVPLPFEIEQTAILKNEGVKKYLPYLIKEAQRLERAGADFIVLPCNSLHIHIDALQSNVLIPILSILEETAQFLTQHIIHKAGVLSTAMTASHLLYEKTLAKYEISCTHPTQEQQKSLNSIVFNLVNGSSTTNDRSTIETIMRSFKDIDCLLLACTDLQLLDLHHPDLPTYDTMQILVDAAVRELTL